LPYYSIGKDVSVYWLSFTICVDSGQLLTIFTDREQNRGNTGNCEPGEYDLLANPPAKDFRS